MKLARALAEDEEAVQDDVDSATEDASKVTPALNGRA